MCTSRGHRRRCPSSDQILYDGDLRIERSHDSHHTADCWFHRTILGSCFLHNIVSLRTPARILGFHVVDDHGWALFGFCRSR